MLTCLCVNSHITAVTNCHTSGAKLWSTNMTGVPELKGKEFGRHFQIAQYAKCPSDYGMCDWYVLMLYGFVKGNKNHLALNMCYSKS